MFEVFSGRPTYKVSRILGRVRPNLRFQGPLEATSSARGPKADPPGAQGRVFDLKLGRTYGRMAFELVSVADFRHVLHHFSSPTCSKGVLGPTLAGRAPNLTHHRPHTTPTGPWTTSNCRHMSFSHAHRSPNPRPDSPQLLCAFCGNLCSSSVFPFSCRNSLWAHSLQGRDGFVIEGPRDTATQSCEHTGEQLVIITLLPFNHAFCILVFRSGPDQGHEMALDLVCGADLRYVLYHFSTPIC